MRQIRCGVFEMNSSSIHSLIVCTKEEYERFKKGELNLDLYTDSLIEVEISEKEKDRLIKLYYDTKELYWKDWYDLTEEEKNEWFFSHQPRGKMGLSYENIGNHDYIIQEIGYKDVVAISVYAYDY